MVNISKSLSNCFEEGFINNDFKNLLLYIYYLQITQIDFAKKEEDVDTAAIGLIGNNYKIKLSESFWNCPVNVKTDAQRLTLLVHEIIHAIEQDCYLHESFEDKTLYNIAVDLKANSIIVEANNGHNLPGEPNTQVYNSVYKPKLKKLMSDFSEGKITNEKLKEEHAKIPIRPILPDDYDDPDINVKNCINNGTKWIYEKLLEDKEKQKQKNQQNNQSSSPGKGFGSPLQHNGSGTDDKSEDDLKEPVVFNDSSNLYVNVSLTSGVDPTRNNFKEIEDVDQAVKDFIDNQLKHSLKQIIDTIEQGGSGIGVVSQSVKKLIDLIKNPPKPIYNWKQHLRKYISMHGKRTNVNRTYSKPNMFIEGNPRLKFSPDMYLLCGLDTSGSMSKNDLEEVVAELYNIVKVLNSSIDLVTMDSNIHDKVNLKSLNSLKTFIQKGGLKGGGGTSIDPFIQELNKCPEYSCGIYLTDGYVDKPRIKNIKPYIILVTSEGNQKINFGVPVVKIPKDYLSKIIYI